MITASALNTLNGVRHAFFTRRGGVSEGIYESLNCGFGSADRPEHVATNRARAMHRLGCPPETLVIAYQTHSANVATVEKPWPPGNAPRVDAMVTRTPGIALGILGADCAPVLFADMRAGVIGAAHVGWRGAKAGILEATVEAMADLGADAARTVAVTGPCIRQASYEVGSEFHDEFVDDDPANRGFFAPARRQGHYFFDLPTYIHRRLVGTGLGEIQTLPIDSCREEDRFFSHRRATLRGEKDCGRGLSAIVLVT